MSWCPGRGEPDHVYHLYTIEHPRRDALAAHLNANGVQTAINYPTALPFLAAYAGSIRPDQFPECASPAGPDPVAADVRGDHAGAAGRGDRSRAQI
jgi:dTDP-4-amino-4,6-dideoxygalactose transaminase